MTSMAIIPQTNDVLFGRGHAIIQHPGNQHFRTIVDLRKQQFLEAPTRKIKRALARDIVNEIHKLGGRFLIEETNPTGTNEESTHNAKKNDIHPRVLAKVWVSVDEDKIMAKVMHRLRDKPKQPSQEVKSEPRPLAATSSLNNSEASPDEGMIRSYDNLGKACDDNCKPNPLETLDDVQSWSQSDIETDEISLSSSPAYDGSTELDLYCDQLVDECDRMLNECDNGNEELNSFLAGITPCNGEVATEHVIHEGTMRQWIERSKRKYNAGDLGYVKSALPIAVKMTECLIEAEKDEHSGQGNPIPLASITAANVLVRAKELPLNKATILGSEGDVCTDRLNVSESSETKEFVDYVSFMSCMGDNSNAGGVISRLSALGFVLFELFAGEEPPFEGDTSNPDTLNLMSLNSINLNNVEERYMQPRKKSQRSVDVHSKCITRLNCTGIPQSVCALVENLLDSSQDCSYSSFTDLLSDLHLMLEKPSRFLVNIPVNPLPLLLIPDELYGREEEKQRLEESFKQNMDGNCRGAIISGKAGVGKSKLCFHVKTLANKVNGYFLSAKFDQAQDLYPLATVGFLFNSLCDLLARDATEAQLTIISAELESALGVQAVLLLGICPNLAELMPSCLKLGNCNCIDAFMSMQFLLGELLRVVSPHCRRIVFFLDDLQWADSMSIRLLGGLMSCNDNKSVFYMCSYRDNEVNKNKEFNRWLSLASLLCLEKINLDNMSVDSVNQLLSDSLHCSPRITRPLSSVLHQKSGGGNPFFLKQIIESLKDKGYIYFELSFPKWVWQMDRIMELEISDDVVSLLVEEMHKLDEDLQYGLKVASCIGSSVKSSVLDILSRDTGKNLHEILHRISQKGFINFDGTSFSWLHDKVQQAAYYELMPEQERHKNHVRFGLAICAHTLDTKAAKNKSANHLNFSSGSLELNGSVVEHDDLFFLAVNQINRGGCNVLEDSNQKLMVATLNLEAGDRSIELLDFSSALKLFEHGISFLDNDSCWNQSYSLTLDLYTGAMETACSLNDTAAVNRLSKEVLSNAKSDDKLSCLYCGVKSLRMAFKFIDAKNVAVKMLEQLGERLPRPSNDVGLVSDIQAMTAVLQNMSDDSILNLHEINPKKRDSILLNLYHDLNVLFGMNDTTLVADISLRMTQITLSSGLCSLSPLAFAHFAALLVRLENYALGYRLGTLSLRLLDKINAQRYKSSVIAIVGFFVSWVAEPLQSIAETHLLGFKHGLRNGDVVSKDLNYSFYLQTNFFAGQHLHTCRDESREFALQLVDRKQKFLLGGSCLLYVQAVALINGLDFKEEGCGVEKLPSWDALAISRTGAHTDFSRVFLAHKYTRSFLFRLYDDMPQDRLLDDVLENKVPLRSIFHYGILFEGLVSLQFARQTNRNEFNRKGDAARTFFRNLSKHNRQNFESKYLLLEAEMMYTSGCHTQAPQLYEAAIRSAHEHKIIHEEAIASELAGMHLHEVALQENTLSLKDRSRSFFLHSIECYKKWGAFAISKRVEDMVEENFGSNFVKSGDVDSLLSSVFASKEGSSKKRQA